MPCEKLKPPLICIVMRRLLLSIVIRIVDRTFGVREGVLSQMLVLSCMNDRCKPLTGQADQPTWQYQSPGRRCPGPALPEVVKWMMFRQLASEFPFGITWNCKT